MASLITLVDGTVPVAADFNTNFQALNTEVRAVSQGGSGAATFTANGVLLGNATAAFGVTATGLGNSVLAVTTTGGAPAFSTGPTVDALTIATAGTLTVNPSGSIVAAAVTAGTPVQHALYRDNVVKAWLTAAGNSTAAAAAFNVTSIAVNGTGDYTISWDRDFATATSYATVVSPVHNTILTTTVVSQTTGSTRVIFATLAGSAIHPTFYNVLAIGAQ